MSAIMTSTLRLELFFGVPLARATASEAAIFTHTFGSSPEEADAFIEALRSLDGAKHSKAAGFYHTLEGEIEGAVFFGVPVKRIDLHRSAHHVEIGDEIAKLNLAILTAEYDLAAVKTKYPDILKSYGQGEPRVLAILTASH